MGDLNGYDHMEKQRIISSAIRKVKYAYENLGLQTPFNERLLNELLYEGLTQTRYRLRQMIRHDLLGMGQDFVQATLDKTDGYLRPLEEALGNLKSERNSHNTNK